MYYITYQYLCCWRPFSSWWVTVAGLSAIAGIPDDAIVSEVSFQLAVAGGPAVIDFLLLMALLLLLASLLILASLFSAGGFSYWMVQWDILLDCQTIAITPIYQATWGASTPFDQATWGTPSPIYQATWGAPTPIYQTPGVPPSPINQTTWGAPTPIYQATWGVPSSTNQTMCPELRVNRRIAQPGPVRTRALQ